MGEHTYPQYVQRKDISLHIKLDQRTKEELDKLCGRAGLNKSDAVRHSIHAAYSKNGSNAFFTKDFLQKNAGLTKALDSLNATLNTLHLDLRRAGTNLNQIAKKVNMRELGSLRAAQAVNESICELEKIRQKIRDVTRHLYS